MSGCGAPTAPMTSGAQPCIPAAPCGAEKASTTRRSRSGQRSAISCATTMMTAVAAGYLSTDTGSIMFSRR